MVSPDENLVILTLLADENRMQNIINNQPQAIRGYPMVFKRQFTTINFCGKLTIGTLLNRDHKILIVVSKVEFHPYPYFLIDDINSHFPNNCQGERADLETVSFDPTGFS